jgi:lipid II:glycine glycyltransferase (peptidoglycan interpeptide bridge formation enzyme)
VLPYTIIRKAGFRLVRFRLETVPLQDEFDAEQEKVFLNCCIKFFRSAGADLIIPGSNAVLFRTYPDGAVAAPYGTFIKDLNQSEEALFNEVHADFRKKIRSAMRAGVEIKSGPQYLDLAYGMIVDTLKRSGGEVIKEYKEFRKSLLSLGQNVKIFIAEYHGAPQACLVTAFSQYSAYTFYGGTIAEPLKGAMHLLHWEAIRQLKETGVERFNFQGVRINPETGSKQEGIMTFKKRFGGKLVQGYTWKCSLQPWKWAAYSIAVRMLKGGDLVDRERYKLGS